MILSIFQCDSLFCYYFVPILPLEDDGKGEDAWDNGWETILSIGRKWIADLFHYLPNAIKFDRELVVGKVCSFRGRGELRQHARMKQVTKEPFCFGQSCNIWLCLPTKFHCSMTFCTFLFCVTSSFARHREAFGSCTGWVSIPPCLRARRWRIAECRQHWDIQALSVADYDTDHPQTPMACQRILRSHHVH